MDGESAGAILLSTESTPLLEDEDELVLCVRLYLCMLSCVAACCISVADCQLLK